MTAPKLTPAQSAALDLDLLRLLAAHGRPATLSALFAQSWAPSWAVAASDRLLIAGTVRERDGLFELTPAGLAALTKAGPPQFDPKFAPRRPKPPAHREPTERELRRSEFARDHPDRIGR